MNEKFKERLEQLSDLDRQLLGIKLSQIISAQSDSINTSSANRLVAYVEPKAEFDMNKMVSYLKGRLPGYMIPSPIILVDKIPRLPNGKIDQNSLRALQNSNFKKKEIQEPRTDLEQTLVKIWEEVMNFSPISIEDNFFEIGGDSILSIQIIAKARGMDIIIKPNQLFEHQTIAELSAFLDYNQGPTDQADAILTGEIALTPIQDWFFETHINAPNYWNHVIKLHIPRDFTIAELKKVIVGLIKHHDALRLCFMEEADTWKALIRTPKSENNVIVHTLHGFTNKKGQEIEIQRILRMNQAELSLDSSPLFRLLYFDCLGLQDDEHYLIAHHLIIDHVSWNLIIEDLKRGLKQSQNDLDIRFGPKIANLKDWSVFLDKLASSEKIIAELPYWKEQLTRRVNVPIDKGERQKFYSEKHASLNQIKLNRTISTALAETANLPYNTHTDELIIAAFIMTMTEWTKNSIVQFGMEKHGRPSNYAEIDVSGTIGWFTSFFPVSFQYTKEETLATLIRDVKEQMRNIPSEGIGFGILKYKTDHGEQLQGDPEVIFNYLGHQNKQNDNSMLSFQYHNALARHPESERSFIIEINSYFSDKILHVDIWYATEVLEPKTINIFMDNFQNSISEIIQHCLSKEEKDFTPSDFPEANINQEDLDNLLTNL